VRSEALGLVVRQRIRFESEATPSSQPAPGGVQRARRARMFDPKNKNKTTLIFRASLFWNSKPHDQLVQGSLPSLFLLLKFKQQIVHHLIKR
jgi:hypothetical protein